MAKQESHIPSALLAIPTAQYLPTIVTWNRLEGRPRTINFDRALRAEIRDPLWLLSKQWQMGEFQGEDAASVVLAQVQMKRTALTKYQPVDGNTSSMNYEVPLEVKVENQKIPFQVGAQAIAYDMRLLMGRHWLKLLKSKGFNLKSEYRNDYGFTAPNPNDEGSVQITAHLEVWQHSAAIAQRNIDGHTLYLAFKSNADTVVPPVGKEVEMEALRKKFIKWFEELFYQPIEEDNKSWKPSYLEHQFSCSAPNEGEEKVLIADEYYHGHLDWYNLDVHNELNELGAVGGLPNPATIENRSSYSFIPSPVTFPGMPHNRWWTLEDWKTNWSNINPDTTDLQQLMLLDFSLNYANDWFMVPVTLPIGSIANVEGLVVTNVFGERTWVEAAGKGQDEDWNKWGMYNLNVRGDMEVPTDLSLVLLPASPKVLESKPIEEIYLLRDEIANMVWGVESKVPLANGGSKSGREAATELKNKYQQLMDMVGPAPLPIVAQNDAKIRYEIVNAVPEEWIPFIPTKKAGSNREIQLQRAAMPRILEGDTTPPAKIEPRTSLLREGLDLAVAQPYFLHEEEVLRAGVKVQKSYQQTRWLNGKVFNWVGFKKEVGRGEGYSGLAYDQIIPVKKE